MDSMELDRVNTVLNLLMMSSQKWILLSEIHHCRLFFGIPNDFRVPFAKYPNWFRIVVDGDGRRVLAISSLEREFMVDEEMAKRALKFSMKHGKNLDLDEDKPRKLNLLNMLLLVSPYLEGSKLNFWTLEIEKYRVGVLHEFLSLILEKKASMHHMVEFKEEFSLTKHTYQTLLKQPRHFIRQGQR
ncbi:hypothetical protein FEM48_Zijuj08G0195900 [Ziziphus jujuba var. spinosa]|uniref:PORR domain-containing protein n=1 Tax=Ziziphus jujuba var. spinosa TaxID=714518 RepID=A0A978V0Z5_ZIZJJ|nr:hypothetical protein FEM48_Zijuj08G0195900 [Ziziphus jujuba var. spinosa]